jgi:hypothetical protein
MQAAEHSFAFGIVPENLGSDKFGFPQVWVCKLLKRLAPIRAVRRFCEPPSPIARHLITG